MSPDRRQEYKVTIYQQRQQRTPPSSAPITSSFLPCKLAKGRNFLGPCLPVKEPEELCPHDAADRALVKVTRDPCAAKLNGHVCAHIAPDLSPGLPLPPSSAVPPAPGHFHSIFRADPPFPASRVHAPGSGTGFHL